MKRRVNVLLFVFAILIAIAVNYLADKARQNERERASVVVAFADTVAVPTETAATTTTTTKAPEKTVTVIATAYCACETCCGIWAENRPIDEYGNEIVYTASGARAYAGHTIAVDTDVFPFGTVLVINGVEYVAEDTGAVIIGNKIDIYFDDHEEALQFGLQELVATVKDT